jgi:hypothetical protein
VVIVNYVSPVYTCIYGSTALLDSGCFSSFLNLHTVVRTPWTRDQPVSWQLPTLRITWTLNLHTQTSMPRVGFEPMSPVLERAKTVHALDRAAAMTGLRSMLIVNLITDTKACFEI